MKICAATGNAGKLRELRRILEAQGHEVVSQKELGITIEPEETGTTFAENALIKAETICKASGLPTIADDSGLCVDALDGAPGVHSHRFAGEGATDADRNAKLLELLDGVPAEKRTARFECVLCYVDAAGETHFFSGTCEGRIGTTPAGENGFGYDPLFCVGDRTMAQMTEEEKNQVSHRANALAKLARYFQEK